MTSPAMNQLKSLVASLTGAPLSRPGLEALFGVKLEHLPYVEAERPYYFRELAQGPFARIEFREPNAQQTQGWQLAIVDLREGTNIPATALQGDLVPAGTMPSFEHDGAEGALVLTATGPGHTTHFQFGARSQILKRISVHRDLTGGKGGAR